MAKKKKKTKTKTISNNKNKKKKKQKKQQKVKILFRLFPNRYDLPYAGRDTVNQAAYHAPKLIKKLSDELNSITKQRIDQFISREGREDKRILPKIVCSAMEDIYQTPFRLLRNFGKKQFVKLKRQFIK